MSEAAPTVDDGDDRTAFEEFGREMLVDRFKEHRRAVLDKAIWEFGADLKDPDTSDEKAVEDLGERIEEFVELLDYDLRRVDLTDGWDTHLKEAEE